MSTQTGELSNPPGSISDVLGEQAPELPAEEQRRNVLRGGLWGAAGQLLPTIGTAVLSVAAGRYLGSGPLGQQSLIAYVNSALSSVIVVSLNTALLQAGGRLQGQGDKRRLQSLMRWAVGAHLGSGLVVLSVLATTAGLVGENRTSWLIIGTVSVLDAAADGMAVRLVLTEGWVPIGRLRLIFQLIGPPLGIVFLFAGYGIAGIFFGDGLAALGLLLAVAVRFRRLAAREVPAVGASDTEADVRSRAGASHSRRKHRVSLHPPVRVARSYALFAVAGVITQVVTKRVEFVVLAIFSTDVALGIYSVAFMAVSLISMVPLAIAYAAMPMIAAAEARGELDRATYHLRFALKLGTMITIPMAALLAALGPAAVVFVFGSHYYAAARLVPITALGLLVAVMGGVCTQFWSGQGRLGIVLGTGAIAGVVDLGVAFAVIPHLAALGAVLSNLAGQVTLGISMLVVTTRRTGAVGWRMDGILRMTVASGLGAAAASLVTVGVDDLVPAGSEARAATALLLGGAVGVAVVIAVARRIKLFDSAECAWLGPLLPGRLRRFVEQLTLAERT